MVSEELVHSNLDYSHKKDNHYDMNHVTEQNCSTHDDQEADKSSLQSPYAGINEL